MGRYAKALVAIATAGLIALDQGLDDGLTGHDWVTIGLAVLGALAVYLVPNDQEGTGGQ